MVHFRLIDSSLPSLTEKLWCRLGKRCCILKTSQKWRWSFSEMLMEFARNIDSIYKTSVHSPFSSGWENCSNPWVSCPWSHPEKHTAWEQGSFQRRQCWSLAVPVLDHLVCLQQHLVQRLPSAEERGKGEQKHCNLKDNWIGSSLQHVGSIFLKKLIV